MTAKLQPAINGPIVRAVPCDDRARLERIGSILLDIIHHAENRLDSKNNPDETGR